MTQKGALSERGDALEEAAQIADAKEAEMRKLGDSAHFQANTAWHIAQEIRERKGVLRVRGPRDLVLHDWANMPLSEQRQALADVRALAETHTGTRARAINIVASFFHFVTPAAGDTEKGGSSSSTGVTLSHEDAIRVAAALLREVHEQDPLRGNLGQVVHDLLAEAVR